MEKMFRDLTKEERDEAVEFIEMVFKMWYEWFNEYKKNNKYGKKLLNWCRIKNDYPELNKKWEEEFVKPDKKKKEIKREEYLVIKMAINITKFTKEHLINNPDDQNEVKYHYINQDYFNDDDQILIWIPYSHYSLTVNKFGYPIWVSRKEYPNMFKEIMNNYPKYQGEAKVTSNHPKYWQIIKY